MSILRNYLKIALRSLSRDRAYACISVAGLAVGMTVCMLMVLYARYELSFDRFHARVDHIYRVTTEERSADGDVDHYALTFAGLACGMDVSRIPVFRLSAICACATATRVIASDNCAGPAAGVLLAY